jgi:hypothetical protein
MGVLDRDYSALRASPFALLRAALRDTLRAFCNALRCGRQGGLGESNLLERRHTMGGLHHTRSRKRSIAAHFWRVCYARRFRRRRASAGTREQLDQTKNTAQAYAPEKCMGRCNLNN